MCNSVSPMNQSSNQLRMPLLAEMMAMENRNMNDEFWSKIERDIGVIPRYLKNILNLSGFNNLISIRCIEDSTLTEIENFVRTELSTIISHKNPSSQNINLYDYFSIYHNSPEYFKLAPGHKILLLNLKNYITDKGLDYFLNNSNQIANCNVILNDNSIPAKMSAPFVEQMADIYKLEKSMYVGPPLADDGNPQKLMKRKNLDSRTTMDSEMQILLKSLNNWLRNYRKKMATNAHLMNDVVTVDIIPNRANSNLRGVITCSYCNIHIKIATDKTANGHRWIISNFMKHYKRHFETPNCTVKEKEDQAAASKNSADISISDVILKQEFMDDEYSISD